MTILFVPRETADGERRVAATPDTVKQLVSAGLDVHVESGAGEAIRAADDDYTDVGARVADDRAELLSRADIVCTVGPLPAADAARMRQGAVLLGFLAPDQNPELVRTLLERGVTSLSLELVPRITRAQPMDALSSQASIAGYRAVILAASLLDKQFPLAMTAAGTIRPATVVIIGAGVAGLQAVATARRLGAVVEVSDIREEVRAEVESLGATFIEPPEVQESEDGYAQEVGKDFLTLQREQLTRHLAQAHAVITTAAIPGRPAPEIVSAEMVEAMRGGSVLIDLAAATGGNCALTPEHGEVTHGDVRVVAAPNLPATMPTEASSLYARNVLEVVTLLLDEEAGIDLDLEDEIVAGALLTLDGEVRHGPTAEQLGLAGQPDRREGAAEEPTAEEPPSNEPAEEDAPAEEAAAGESPTGATGERDGDDRAPTGAGQGGTGGQDPEPMIVLDEAESEAAEAARSRDRRRNQ